MPSDINIYLIPSGETPELQWGVQLEIDDCDGSANQQWLIHGGTEIRGIDNYCLDIPQGNTTDGTVLDYCSRQPVGDHRRPGERQPNSSAL